MRGRAFIDTNVLIYAEDLEDRRHEAALALVAEAIAARSGAISTQVLGEFYSVATRKLGVTPESARRRMEAMAALDVVRPDVPDVLAAVDLVRLHRLSFWDALILRSAKIAGCSRLISEDMSHGQVIDGVLIENPFRDSEEDEPAAAAPTSRRPRR